MTNVTAGSPPRRAGRIAIAFGLGTLVAVACGDSIRDQQAKLPGAPRELAVQLQLAANLEPFDDCEELLGYFEDANNEMNRAVGDFLVEESFDGPVPVAGGTGRAVAGAAPEAGADAAAQSPGALGETTAATGGPDGVGNGGGVSTGFSTTNIQEAGVDEPDLVKTNGELIASIGMGRLHLVDPEGGATRVVGSVALPDGSHEIFLHDDRVVVLTRSYLAVPQPGVSGGGTDAIYPSGSATVVSAVDITDPSAPVVTDSASFEGDYVSARLHDGVIRLVLTSFPTLYGIAEDTEINDWLPNQVEGQAVPGTEGEAPTTTENLLVPCDQVSRPPEQSGTGTVTVLTIAAGGDMEPIDTDAVVADAGTIYASTETLYVATNRWFDPGANPEVSAYTTEMHAFDISDPAQTSYVASGRVRGHLLNQYSVSEDGENLRVATTDGAAGGFDPGQPGSSESFVTVMRRDGEQLDTIGQVGGLGKGEEIQSVRFIGDLGFVVTFRQIDPLYAIDLSEPTAPKVLGELKVEGFSAYLHPIGDGRLLGVGQDATAQGAQIGTQVSLFDTSNPRDLKRLDNVTIENALSSVEHDAKAFLFWADRNLALVPIEIYGPPVPLPGPGPGTIEPVPPGAEPAADDRVGVVAPQPSDTFSGLIAFTVRSDDVAEAARITHEGKPTTTPPGFDYSFGGPPIQRAVVVGGSLYTLSDAGVLASDLATLGDQVWAQFELVG